MKGIFEVVILDESLSKERTVRVQALSQEEAIRKVAALGAVIKSAQLTEVIDDIAIQSPATTSSVPSRMLDAVSLDKKYRADNANALAFAWLGLIFVPLAIVGLIWGIRLTHLSDGKYGNGATGIGLTLVIIWGLVIFVTISGN